MSENDIESTDKSDSCAAPLTVSLAAFEGPLDLLLHLIREQKVDIFDIPIAEITEKYLECIKVMAELDLDVSGDFLVMASTLLFIKSKMLLPVDPDEEDEAEDGVDPREELVRKLLEYQSFKEAAKELGDLAKEQSQVFTRQLFDAYDQDVEEEADKDFNADLYDLIQAFSRILRKPPEKKMHEVYEESVSVEEKMAEIKRVIKDKGRMLFSECFPRGYTINLLVATFFAILELCKQKNLSVRQDTSFGEIVLEKKHG